MSSVRSVILPAALSALMGGVLLLVLAIVPGHTTANPSLTAASNPMDKVAPWVIAHTAGGVTAEFLVILSAQADLSGIAYFTPKVDKGRYTYQMLYQTAQLTQKPIRQWLADRNVEHRPFYIVNALWVKADRSIALQLAARSDVARIEGNPVIKAPLPRGRQLFRSTPGNVEPNLTYVHAPDVWALGYTGQGIVVGGQDTGYRWDHPALKSKYRGWNGIDVDHDYNWHDSIHTGNGACGADSPAPCDVYGHGTHTMGTMVGDDDKGNQVGMAPGAQWIGCRNMDNNGNGTPATYLECFEFFLAPYPVGGTPEQGDPDKAPDVTNNSWGCPPSEGCSADTLLQAVQAQRAAGIMTVSSAGNYGRSVCSTVRDPIAIYDETYTVGALNSGQDTLAGFSSVGPVTSDGSQRRKPDITAPGTSIRSSTKDGAYGYMSGTSMAAPHVAGAIALLWSARPALANQITATEDALNAAATHIVVTDTCGSTGWPNNIYGYGRLDVLAAISAPDAQLMPAIQTQTVLIGKNAHYTLTLTNAGNLTATFELAAQAAWPLAFSPLSVTLPAHNSAPVAVTVTVPLTALDYARDTALISALSGTATTPLSATAELRTTALYPYRWYWPIFSVHE
jgi:subtilisin family serine protease